MDRDSWENKKKKKGIRRFIKIEKHRIEGSSSSLLLEQTGFDREKSAFPKNSSALQVPLSAVQ